MPGYCFLMIHFESAPLNHTPPTEIFFGQDLLVFILKVKCLKILRCKWKQFSDLLCSHFLQLYYLKAYKFLPFFPLTLNELSLYKYCFHTFPIIYLQGCMDQKLDFRVIKTKKSGRIIRSSLVTLVFSCTIKLK